MNDNSTDNSAVRELVDKYTKLMKNFKFLERDYSKALGLINNYRERLGMVTLSTDDLKHYIRDLDNN